MVGADSHLVSDLWEPITGYFVWTLLGLASHSFHGSLEFDHFGASYNRVFR